MKKLLSLLAIGFILCSPLLLKSAEQQSNTIYWIKLKNGLGKLTQQEVDLLSKDSDVIKNQLSGPFQQRGGSFNEPIQLPTIDFTSFSLYLDALKLVQTYKESDQIPDQKLPLKQVNSLLAITDYLQSKTNILYPFIARELLWSLKDSPPGTFDAWLAAG